MITFADDVYRPMGEEDEGCAECVVVTTDFDPADVVTALERTAVRFMRVDEEGHEYPTHDGIWEAARLGLYTPNYVSDPYPDEDGTGLYVDCKSAAPPEMGETFRRILREELERAVLQAHVRVPRPELPTYESG